MVTVIINALYINTGADVVGINCCFGPNVAMRSMKIMKEALDAANLKPYLICQPLALLTPDIDTESGYLNTPEHFLGKFYVYM